LYLKKAANEYHYFCIGAEGTGSFQMGNASGTGTISETGTGNGIHMLVRDDSGASGTITGWGTVDLTGSLTNNGRIVANGFAVDRNLDLSSFTSVNNTIPNGTTETNGWYAENQGQLVLPAMAVATGNGTYNWGEAPYDSVNNPSIDLVNSMQLTFTNVATAGSVSISLMATDRTDIPAELPTGCTTNSAWKVTSSTLAFDSANVTFRYDPAIEATDRTLLVLRYDGSDWVIDVNPTRNTTNKLISIGMTALSPYYAVVRVIPGDANLDGSVDVGDLGILAANYGITSGATWEMGDFNGDGAVDVGDLGILSAHY
jgi:hypothetical protein